MYVDDTNGWIDPLGLAGIGGAYMFEFESGNAYIGKGQESRMTGSNGSIATRTKQDIAKGGNGKIAGQASIETKFNGKHNNELGKMVEYKVMKDSGFEGGKKMPKNYLNNHLSGATAWKNNPKMRDRATELAVELKKKFEQDKVNRKKSSYSK